MTKQTKPHKTVGAASQELLQKAPFMDHTAVDQNREMLSDYDKNIFECIETHKKKFDGDFFVVVVTKKEPLMQNVIRNYFIGRRSCPKPDYDQIVYRFDHKANEIFFLWVIPSKHTCFYMIENALDIPPEEKELLGFVLKFADGTLFKWCKQLNKEKDDSVLLA